MTMDDGKEVQLKAELAEIYQNIDAILEKIQTAAPAAENTTESAPPADRREG